MEKVSYTVKARNYQDGSPIQLSVSKGKIEKIEAATSDVPEDLLIGPGFMDIQVNGYAGLDYNQIHAEVLTLGHISGQLLKSGVTSHFPTVITNHPDAISALLRQVVRLRDEDPLAGSCIPGIHLEGPFISPQDGPRGAPAGQ